MTVTDQTGGVIPNARVTVTAQDAANAVTAIAPVTTVESGIATVEHLKPGRYTIQAEFPGFEAATVRDVRVGATGNVRRTIVLPIKKVAEDVTVGRDKQSSALDPLGNSFSTVLTREQIAALPDDPDEMEKVLKAMAPPGAQIRVDGFTGGKLPPKSQIRSIRLPRMDQIAAQNHGGAERPAVHRHHDAAGQRAAAWIARLHVPRRRAEREEPVHAGERPGEPEAGRVLVERLDRAEQVVVLAADAAGRSVRHDEPARGAS